MLYENLHELIVNSSSTRRYFMSLEPRIQTALHERNLYIHTANELRLQAAYADDYLKHIKLSGCSPEENTVM